MIDTKYILEYRYADAPDNGWREEDVFNCARDAHFAFTKHVNRYVHIEARVRKVRYIAEEEIVGEFRPISSEDYE